MKSNVRQLLAVLLGAAPLIALAQSPWPSKPIRAIVPFAAGASTDVVARLVLEQVSKQLGQPIIVDNKPGAGTTIGTSAVAHADPDGYTILVNSNSLTVTPATYKTLPYDPVKDLSGVIPLASVPMVLVMSPSKGVKTLPDLVRTAKANPGALNFASAGTGGATHLGAERMLMAGGISGTHVPYKSSSEALTEVVAGRVDFYLSPIGLASAFMKTDKLTALAVSSSKRSSALPEVPTTIEAGLAQSNYDVWIGLFVPSKTPRAIVNRLNEETAKALRSPELREKYATQVMDTMIMSPGEFDNFLKRDYELNAELVKAAGIQPN